MQELEYPNLKVLGDILIHKRLYVYLINKDAQMGDDKRYIIYIYIDIYTRIVDILIHKRCIS